MKTVNIAIVGATGLVGETVIKLLPESKLNIGQIFPLASEKSTDEVVRYQGKSYKVQDLAKFDFAKADLAIFTAGSKVSEKFAKKAIKNNCWVIDNSSFYRYDKNVPLIVPEINIGEIKKLKKCSIIANPNCSTIQMLVAIYPIYQHVGISRINVATYQSVSGAGRKAISELLFQTGELLNGRPVESKLFPKLIAFNTIPHIDEFLDNGYTKEEMKMYWETQKILNDSDIKVNATAARLPTVFCHSEAVHIETKKEISLAKIKDLLKKTKGVKLIDKKLPYPTAMTDAVGNNLVYVGRLRKDISHPLGINMWVVADNVRKGGAWNAIQIAEELSREKFI